MKTRSEVFNSIDLTPPKTKAGNKEEKNDNGDLKYNYTL